MNDLAGTMTVSQSGRVVLDTDRQWNRIEEYWLRRLELELMRICKCQMVDTDTIVICDNCKEALVKP
jgi:hypothetical protein